MTTTVSCESSYPGTRVLVLGAAGFIGRWVARALCRLGVKPTLVVRNRSSALPIFARYAIDAEPIQADLRDVEIIRELVTTIKPEITFNLAGYGVDRTEGDEASAYQINARIGFTVCQVLSSLTPSTWQGQAIVHAGSALEYGMAEGILSEDTLPHPTSLYGRSKLAGTQLLLQCCNTYGVRGMSVRVFQAYGPGEHEGRLIPTLLRAAQTGESIELTSGEQKRDFIYVEDVVEGFLRLGLANVEWGEVVNLATGRMTSVREFVQAAATVLPIPADHLKFGALPLPPEEMMHAGVSIARLEYLTGWSPPTDIADGIRKTVEFMRR